jgi:hypothetical protein
MAFLVQISIVWGISVVLNWRHLGGGYIAYYSFLPSTPPP